MTSPTSPASLYAGTTTPTEWPAYISGPPVAEATGGHLVLIEGVGDVDEHRLVGHRCGGRLQIERAEFVVGSEDGDSVTFLEVGGRLDREVEGVGGNLGVGERIVADVLDIL